MAIEQFAAPETLRGAGQDQAQFLTDLIRFETVHFEPEKFHVLPSIDREGTLVFLQAFGFSGNVTIEVWHRLRTKQRQAQREEEGEWRERSERAREGLQARLGLSVTCTLLTACAGGGHGQQGARAHVTCT
eukprot:3154438-Rhodomonas_salina.2